VGETAAGIPKEFKLGQNYPNPFNPATQIAYQLPGQRHVTLTVYNVIGQEIARLVDEMQEPGYKTISWNAGRMPSGVYYYRLQAAEFVETKSYCLSGEDRSGFPGNK